MKIPTLVLIACALVNAIFAFALFYGIGRVLSERRKGSQEATEADAPETQPEEPVRWEIGGPHGEPRGAVESSDPDLVLGATLYLLTVQGQEILTAERERQRGAP